MVPNLHASSHIDAKLVDKEVNAHLEIFLLVNDIPIISMMKYYFSSHANTHVAHGSKGIVFSIYPRANIILITYFSNKIFEYM